MSKTSSNLAAYDGDFMGIRGAGSAESEKDHSSYQDLAYLGEQGKRQQFKVTELLY